MSWNPEQYLKFAQPRLRPALDLLGRIGLARPQRIYDLGCGAGNVTRVLLERWPDADITGVDDSAAMLAKAAEVSSRIRWVEQNLADWRPDAPADLIFSNAALHWLPNHERLMPALVDALTPGGVLAVQMPRNFLASSHRSIYETVRSGPWRDKLDPLIARRTVGEPQFYHSLLESRARTLDIWETEYLHVLEGENAVKEWTKGTALKPFLDVLEEPERGEFEAEYARRVAHAYPRAPGGKTLFPFRRLFIVLER